MAGIFVLKMKKNCALILILLLSACLLLCACDASKMFPWGDKTVNNNDGKLKTFTIYVYGAVENEGYYEVEEGSTYLDAIVQAGMLAQSIPPQSAESLVNGKQTSIVVQYAEDGKVRDCTDVNSAFFLLRDPNLFDGVFSQEVVNKLADYLQSGTIHNKQVLREVLGEDDYEHYHYKLYVAEADYEKAD